MILMGLPLDSLNIDGFSDRAPFQQNGCTTRCKPHCYSATKELHKLVGNGMAMRSLYVAMIIGLMALSPWKVKKYLKG